MTRKWYEQQRSLLIGVLGFCLWVGAPAGLRAQVSDLLLCSAGVRDGGACVADQDCPDGACVRAFGICDGGSADGFECDCPFSECTLATPCANDPTRGTCAGGPSAGKCCALAFNCPQEQVCRETQRVCEGGAFRSFSCLNNAHCNGATCRALGRVCADGPFALFPCVDNRDCPGGTCVRPGQECQGDCNGDSEVTVDEVLSLVGMALGTQSVAQCPAGDGNNDQDITVDEILVAIENALSGCPVL